jgi:4-amino-4-deoxy-L-arabinose transferase-like glycosyltransferase
MQRLKTFNDNYKKFSGLMNNVLKKNSSYLTPAILVAIVFVGTFLRFNNIEEKVNFHEELGQSFLEIKNIIKEKRFPFLNFSALQSTYSAGPLYYWIMAPVLLLFKYDPLAGAYFFAFIGAITIIINYEVIEKVFDKNTALLSSLFISISPAWLELAKEAKVYSLVVPLFYPLLFFVFQSMRQVRKPSKNNISWKPFFLSGLFLGLMLNFNLLAISLLLPISVLLILNRKKISSKSVFSFIFGMIIPNFLHFTRVIQNLFSLAYNLFTHFTFRVDGFANLYPINDVPTSSIKERLISFYKFFSSGTIPLQGILTLIPFLVIVIYIVFKIRSEIKKSKTNYMSWIISISMIVGVLVMFLLYGGKPVRYYVVILPFPIIFISSFLSTLIEKKRIRIAAILALLLVALNFKDSSFKTMFKSININQTSQSVTYETQLMLARKVIKLAENKEFELRKAGTSGYHEGSESHNFKYLLWWMGNEPVKESTLVYTIYEKNDRVPNYFRGKMYWIGTSAVWEREKPKESYAIP